MARTAASARSSVEPPSPMERAQHVLADVFGYRQFRSQQAGIIEAVIAGNDALALMPTGGGKSLCYQVPSLVRPGIGIVVSPLIALMQDQVEALTQAGVDAAFLNSTLDYREQVELERRIAIGALDILYVSPERLLQERTLNLLSDTTLALFAIDEAHCVSQWGHDFRPEYRQLKLLAERFPNVPRIALTATADERTREEIVTELRLENARRFIASFDRPNIRYTISNMASMGARERLWRFIDAEHAEDAGIVYCLSRKSVDETAAWLRGKGRTALAYHAGLDADVRRDVLERFRKESGIIVVATIAFGMGIDKPDVRFVAHLNLPKSIEAYYQETGRAGRDGEPANAWLAYGIQDLIQLRQWITQGEGSDAYKQVQRQKLAALIGLCELPSCRRQALLSYFGERQSQPCGNCDNCLEPPETTDGTVLAQKALSAAYRTGQRFGASYIIDVLMGRSNERIERAEHDKLPVFGIGQDTDETTWKGVFRQLTASGYLAGDDEGYGSLQLTEQARPLLRGEEKFAVRLPSKETRQKAKPKRANRSAELVNDADRALFEDLRNLRRDLAVRNKLPPYLICSDVTLAELALFRPTDDAGLADITGLGSSKIRRYGANFLAVIGKHPARAAST
ncbi:DNA helicase RecQ [Hyphomicrobium sulfonivorans]|uniref:DNA helicase RecQ n=1 Tax=Hyphomicrobium sulfonivorans TaxID=121290 RepID=UPI0015708BDE|nr:DNA helicase RecQ [Hyphomicrobium sulfonivorans]MBI1650778.1 DNA helicase RecQ [Hyphomicrobium sulfonivorans]NSL71865.1 DNA helicase RecQ [Hyphomicrobium sulfonivorans]